MPILAPETLTSIAKIGIVHSDKRNAVMAKRSLVPLALRYADQVARSGSIHGAAKELRVAASAIHRQILRLEEDLGVSLFDRLPRGMRPTSSGEAVVGLARRWREDERNIVTETKQLQGIDQGLVRMLAMDSHSTAVLPRLVHGLSERYPRISLSIEIGTTDSVAAALRDGHADLAAVFNLPPTRDILVLWHEDLPFGCVVAPQHSLARRATVSIQEVCAFPVALQSQSLTIRRYIEANFSWLLPDMRSQVESDSLNLIKALAVSASHVAITSELDAASEILAGLLVFIPIRDRAAQPQTVSVAVDARKSLTSLVRAVADEAIEVLRQILAEIRSRKAGKQTS
jgi:DNA-binding transcriptional LysR family regulator